MSYATRLAQDLRNAYDAHDRDAHERALTRMVAALEYAGVTENAPRTGARTEFATAAPSVLRQFGQEVVDRMGEPPPPLCDAAPLPEVLNLHTVRHEVGKHWPNTGAVTYDCPQCRRANMAVLAEGDAHRCVGCGAVHTLVRTSIEEKCTCATQGTGVLRCWPTCRKVTP